MAKSNKITKEAELKMRSAFDQLCFTLALPLVKIMKGLLRLLGKGAKIVLFIQAFKINPLSVADCQEKIK